MRGLVWDVLNHDIDDLVEAQRTLAALHERLKETETYDEILFRPLKETVEAVCADLGLTPDWSRWTGDGWLPPTTLKQWQVLWRPPEPGLTAPSPPKAPAPHGPAP